MSHYNLNYCINCDYCFINAIKGYGSTMTIFSTHRCSNQCLQCKENFGSRKNIKFRDLNEITFIALLYCSDKTINYMKNHEVIGACFKNE